MRFSLFVASRSGQFDSLPFIVQRNEEQTMKRIAMLVVPLSVALFAAGCGNAHDERAASRDLRKLSNETAADVTRAVQDADCVAHDLPRAVNAATANAETDVRQAALQVRDDVARQTEVIQARHDASVIPPANPAQLGREIKRDAVNAAGAAAEDAAESLFKIK